MRLKFLFKKELRVKRCFIIYDSETNNINYIEDFSTKEETSYFILLIITSVLLMIISNLLFAKHKITAILAAALTTIVIFYTIFISTTPIAIFATNAPTPIKIIIVAKISAIFALSFAALAALFATINKDKTDKLFYKVSSILFYISIAVYTILLFI